MGRLLQMRPSERTIALLGAFLCAGLPPVVGFLVYLGDIGHPELYPFVLQQALIALSTFLFWPAVFQFCVAYYLLRK